MKLNEMFFCAYHPFEKEIGFPPLYYGANNEDILVCKRCCEELREEYNCKVLNAKPGNRSCTGCKAVENVTPVTKETFIKPMSDNYQKGEI